MSIAELASRDASIITLQARLLDYSGHVTRGLGHEERRTLLGEINALRAQNGWQPLDMSRRTRRAAS